MSASQPPLQDKKNHDNISQTTEKKITDRLIVSIQNQSYTQSQIEDYLNTKKIFEHHRTLNNQKNSTFQQIDFAQNWQKYILDFTKDMILFNESISSGSFAPPRDIIEKTNSELRPYFENLNYSMADFTSKRNIRMVLQIQNFIKTKTAQENPNIEEMEWYKRLKTKYSVRNFSGSNIYKTLSRNQF